MVAIVTAVSAFVPWSNKIDQPFDSNVTVATVVDKCSSS